MFTNKVSYIVNVRIYFFVSYAIEEKKMQLFGQKIMEPVKKQRLRAT